MAAASDRKLYLGPRLRMLRRELGLNQTRMAEELGVSPSYLNHLERNQRPLTAQMMLRLAEVYDLDVRAFVAGARDAAASDLHEILADPLVREIGVGRQEVMEVAENYPGVGEAVRRLYRALLDLRQLPARVGEGAEAPKAAPLGWVRDWIEAERNHFPDLDAAAEALSVRLGDGPEALHAGLVTELAGLGIQVRTVAADVLGSAFWHFDYHRRRLLVSERQPEGARRFAVAGQVARQVLGESVAAVVDRAAPPDPEMRALATQVAVNWAAAAIVMPYGRFHAAAQAGSYDLDLLVDRFGVSWQQAALRLTTLDRQGLRGVPLFLLVLDAAGNVAKRFGGEAAPLARFGGGCPRWRVHRALRIPGETVIDLVELPDGARYLTWARAVRSAARTEPVLVVLGCEARHMARVGYGAGLAQPTPIGPACQLCERPDCTDRSLPTLTRALDPSPLRRPRAPYPLRAV